MEKSKSPTKEKKTLLIRIDALIKEESGEPVESFALRLLTVRNLLSKTNSLKLNNDPDLKAKLKELYGLILNNELLRILVLLANREIRKALIFEAQDLFSKEADVCQRRILPHAYSFFPDPAPIIEISLQLL